MLMSSDVGEAVQKTPRILLAYVMAIADAFEPVVVGEYVAEPVNPFGDED